LTTQLKLAALNSVTANQIQSNSTDDDLAPP